MVAKQAITRRQFLKLAVAAAAAAGSAALFPVAQTASAPTSGPLPSNIDRAARAYRAQRRFLAPASIIPGNPGSFYMERIAHGGINLYSYLWSLLRGSSLWPFSGVIASTLDLAGLSSGAEMYLREVTRQIKRDLPRYWDGTAYKAHAMPRPLKSAARYYDDNAWIGLSLMRFYRMTGDRGALARARRVFNYITTGWDESTAHPAPGGVFWMEGTLNRDRNTCSNAPSAELGLRLYQATGEDSYLIWAGTMYEWVNSTLLDADGLYWDRIDLLGKIEKTKWSYNQGTMIGAGVLLYTITHDDRYLYLATRTARAAMDYYGTAGYWDQPPAFNTVFFRNLLLWSTVDPTFQTDILETMQQYADEAWTSHRSSVNLFHFPTDVGGIALLNQAAMAGIFASLAWDPADYDLLV